MWIWQLTSCIVWGQLQQLRKEAQRFQARVEGSPGTGNTCHPAKCQQTWNHTSILWQIKLPTHYLRKCFCNAMWNRDPEGICSATPGDGLSVFHCFSTCKVAEVMRPWDQQASYVLRKSPNIYTHRYIDIPIDPYKYCIFMYIPLYIYNSIYTYVYIYIYICIYIYMCVYIYGISFRKLCWVNVSRVFSVSRWARWVARWKPRCDTWNMATWGVWNYRGHCL